MLAEVLEGTFDSLLAPLSDAAVAEMLDQNYAKKGKVVGEEAVEAILTILACTRVLWHRSRKDLIQAALERARTSHG